MATLALFIGIVSSACAPQGTPAAPLPAIRSTHPVMAHARLLPADTALAAFVPATSPHVEALRDGPIGQLLGSDEGSLAVQRRVAESLSALAEALGVEREHVAQVLASGFAVGWHGKTRLGDPKWTAVFDLADTTQTFEARIPELLAEWTAQGAKVESEDWRGTMVHTVGQHDTFSGAFAVRGHTLVVAHNAASVSQALRFQLQLADGKPSLADTARFDSFAATLPAAEQTVATVWADPRRIHELVAPTIDRESRGVLQRTIAELGIEELDSMGYSLARAETALTETVFLALPAPQQGLLGALFRTPATSHAPPHPAGILTGTAHSSWRAVFDSVVELASGLDRSAKEDYVAWEADVADRTGVSFRSDLISLLGDQTSIWAYEPGEDGSDRFAVTVELRDVWAFQQSFERIQTEFAVPVTLDPIGEFQCYRINLRGVDSDAQPRFGIHNGRLVAAVGVRSMHEWLMNLQPPAEPGGEGQPSIPTPPPATAGPSVTLTADLGSWLTRLLGAPTVDLESLGEVTSRVTAGDTGITWTTTSALGNPLLWALIDTYDDLSGSELRHAVQPAPEPIAAEQVPAWNPANTLHRLRHVALAHRDATATDTDGDGIGEFCDLDRLLAEGEGLAGATFHRTGIWMLDSHLIQVMLPTQIDDRESQCAIVAWPAFEATGMVYVVLAEGPVMVNDLMAEVAGLSEPEPHDLFVDGVFGGEFTAGWHPLGIDPTGPTDIAKPEPDQGDPEADARALAGLEEKGKAAKTEAIAELTASTNPTVAARAAWLLGELRRVDALATLHRLTEAHDVHEVRRQAIHSIYRIGDPSSVAACVTALDDADEQVRTMAAATLGRLRNKQALEPLMDFLSNRTSDGGSGSDVTQALLSLRDLNSPDCLRSTAAATGELDRAGGEALTYLFQELSPQLGDDEANTLIGTLEHPCSLLRRYSIQRLGEVGDKSAASALEKRLAIESAALQDLLQVSIDAIRGNTTTPDNPLLEVREKTLDLWDRAVARWHKLNDTQRYVAMGGAGAVVLIILGLVIVLRRRRHAQAADDALAFLEPSEGFEEQEDDEGEWEDEVEDESPRARRNRWPVFVGTAALTARCESPNRGCRHVVGGRLAAVLRVQPAHRERRRHLAIAFALGLALTDARAQRTDAATPWSVELTLAADRSLSGPPAWTWVRDEHLRATCEEQGVDPRAPLSLHWDHSGLEIAPSAQPPLGGCYLTGSARLGPFRAWIAGDADGTEDWTIEGPVATPGPHPANFLGLRPGSERCYDVGTLLASFGPPGAFDDPSTLLLAAAGAACGETRVACTYGADGTLRVQAQGGGGLVLPAALLALARIDRRGVGGLLAPAPPTPNEHWLRMARVARGSYREEALRQLTLIDGTAAEQSLRRAMLADEWIRVVAMRSLADRIALGVSSPAALANLAAAADRAQPGARDTARAAIGRLWPTADPGLRRRLRAASAGLTPDAWPPAGSRADLPADLPAGLPAGPERPGSAHQPWRAAVWVWLLLSTAIGLAAWQRPGR